jgi:hypothetical protein
MNQHEPVAQPSILRNLLVSQTTDNLSSKRPPQKTWSTWLPIRRAEGYIYLQEGFRVWFGNGEVISFRADTKEKREWVNVLQGVVGKVPVRKEWAEAVLLREKSMK